MTRKAWTTRGILALALILVVCAAMAARGKLGRRRPAAVAEAVTPGARPVVEVVFVLDTTGSMSGLIEGAKAKIWQIAGHIVSGQPAPDVRIGLIAYRDKQDEYVTRVVPLTADLDQVYSQLMSFRADGGGDAPEHVNRGLDQAIHDMRWSPGAMKMIFLVGDAPPHDDYTDVADSRTLAREAQRSQIVIHTVRCGRLGETEVAWRAIASLGGGRFSSIEQDGGVVAVSTPVDARLAELNRRLTETTILYGDDGVRQGYEAKVSAGIAAPASTAADRARFFAAKPEKKMADEDILDDLAEGRKDVGSLDPADLPAEMRPMSGEERRAHVARLKGEREAIVKEIGELSKERDRYVRTEMDKRGGGPGGFDKVVEGAVSDQGAKFGITY